ncbi:hypothetical protein DMUE_2126 [Dictyocoela muelleri]|nr:hypothetical protein DMUE_2126 [Dictyocoela muelleri]
MLRKINLIFTFILALIAKEFKSSGSVTDDLTRSGHGGVSHGDNGCPGYDTEGGMGGDYEHHRGPGTHSGDTGNNGIIFTKDVVHHPDGEIYVDMENPPIDGMDIKQLHDQILDDIQSIHDATIARKLAEQEAAKLAAEIADEKIKKAKEDFSRLKQLDDQAAIEEHKNPEVLGKQVIPVANFTVESFPLNHHIRNAARRIAAIQAIQDNIIEAQRRITRLEDITDKLKTPEGVANDNEIYKQFLDAASLGEPFYFPVASNNGTFYISPHEGDEEAKANGGYAENDDLAKRDMAHDPVSGGHYKSPDGHTHFVDHGDTSGPNRGGLGNGEGMRTKSPIIDDPSRFYNYPEY